MNERFDLVRSYIVASVFVIGIGMLLVGVWVTSTIREAASENAGAVAAHYVDGIVAPLTQALKSGAELDEATRQLLDSRLTRGLMNRSLYAFKIWLPDGRIAYASDPGLVGRSFPMTQGLAAAAAGEIHVELNQLADAENELDRQPGVPLLEVYSPIRDAETGTVIGVVEFYDAATELEQELDEARRLSWLVIGLASVAMLTILSGVILRGGRLIKAQRARLGEQIAQLSGLLADNRSLSDRVDQANKRAASINEQILSRISAEIHDGPVQQLAFASMRLKPPGKRLAMDDRASVILAVDEAAKELRLLARGLTLPALQGMAAHDVVKRAVAAHEKRTGEIVDVDVDDGLPLLSQAENICIYRVVQEALNNASRHAGGRGLRVRLETHGDLARIAILDGGGGFNLAAAPEGLGLAGMRERVAGLGGVFDVESTHLGTTISATLPVRTIQ